MQHEAPRIALVVADTGASLTAAQAALDAFCRAQAVPPLAAGRAAVLVEEVAVNALRHGGATLVRVSVGLAADACRLAFEDDGRAFDPTAATLPAPARSLEEAPDGGRGLVLLHRLANGLGYRRDGPLNRLEASIARA
jgi:anti-sigma regulatory factor (Ser/Thr protein kinase)